MKKRKSIHIEARNILAPVKAKKPGGPKTNRTEHMALRLTKGTRKAVEAAAYDTHRTSSNWIETAILWALDQGAVHARQVVPRGKVD